MRMEKPRRIMWLLNHTEARKYEVPMLKRIGITEIFQPKSHPGLRSSSIDYSEDANLTIPPEDLAILNKTDWYGSPSPEVWTIVNRHFDLMFFIFINSEFFPSLVRHYQGAAIWRVYGREITANYDWSLKAYTRGKHLDLVRALGPRLIFGEAYEHLHQIEPLYLRQRAIFLPLGLQASDVDDKWNGTDKRVLFVCPDIESSSYYLNVYEDFIRDFGDLPYVVGGTQLIPSRRPHVLGFLPNSEYERNMREMRVMYYHSEEPNHIHYHPFEAIRAGMPLIFRGGGILDRLGGVGLPGRATSVREARTKIKRILNGDEKFTRDVRASQAVLLNGMSESFGEMFWRAGMEVIQNRLSEYRFAEANIKRLMKLAIIVPVGIKGGVLKSAKLLAEAISEGAKQAGANLQIILAYCDENGSDLEEVNDLPNDIVARSFSWRGLGSEQARHAMEYAGNSGWLPSENSYLAPDDGINYLCDANAWLVISNRLDRPLLPIRPIINMNDEYLMRYVDIWRQDLAFAYVKNDWNANSVLVTTDLARNDAQQFAAVSPAQVQKLPVLIGPPPSDLPSVSNDKKTSFLWVTTLSPHKNHEFAVHALDIYYRELGGLLKCVITGVGIDKLVDVLESRSEKAAMMLRRLIRDKKVKLKGELSDLAFQAEIAKSAFVWNPVKVDSGTFLVVEAAYLGVPSLSGDYPSMRETDQQLSLGITFRSATNAKAMADGLLWFEDNSEYAKSNLPQPSELASHSPKNVGFAYWEAVRPWL